MLVKVVLTRRDHYPPQTPNRPSPCLPRPEPLRRHQTAPLRVCPANLRPPSTEPALPVSARRICAFHPPNQPFPCLSGKSSPSIHRTRLFRVCPANLRPPSTEPALPVTATPRNPLQTPNGRSPCLPRPETLRRHQSAPPRVCHAPNPTADTEPPLPVSAQCIWERSLFTCRTFPGQMPFHHSLLPIPRSRSSPQNQTVPIAVGPSRVWRGAQGSHSMASCSHGQDFRHFPARSMVFRTHGQDFRHFPARSMVSRAPIRIIFKFTLRKLKKSYFMACFRR